MPRLRWTRLRIATLLGLSTAMVSRILNCAGLRKLGSLDPPPLVVSYEHKVPRDLIHLRLKRLIRIAKPGHCVHSDRTREARGAGYEFLHIAATPESKLSEDPGVNDHSRTACAAILRDQTSASATQFFHLAKAQFSRFSVSCCRVLTTDPAIGTGASKDCCAAKTSVNASLGPTLHAVTVRPNSLSKPPCASGLTAAPTKTQPISPNSSTSDFTTTISTALMSASDSNLLPPARA